MLIGYRDLVSDQDNFYLAFKPQIQHVYSRHYSLYFFLFYWLREFVETSRHLIFGDHLIHSHDLYIWSGTDIVRRNWMLVTIGA